MTARGPLLGVALATSLLGCGPHRDCSLMLDAVAPRLARIKETQATTHEATSGTSLRATSAAYTELAGALEHVEIPEGDTRALARKYQEIAVDLALGYELLAKALETEDAEKMKAAKTVVARGDAHELMLIHDVGSLCSPR